MGAPRLFEISFRFIYSGHPLTKLLQPLYISSKVPLPSGMVFFQSYLAKPLNTLGACIEERNNFICSEFRTTFFFRKLKKFG